MPASTNCREASRLLSVAFERALDDAESQSLRHHLGLCLMCRNFDAQLKFLRRAASRFRGGAG